MARKRLNKRRSGRDKADRPAEPLRPDAQARYDRKVTLLLGRVPLPQMTQEEADWVLAQKLVIGGDR